MSCSTTSQVCDAGPRAALTLPPQDLGYGNKNRRRSDRRSHQCSPGRAGASRHDVGKQSVGRTRRKARPRAMDLLLPRQKHGHHTSSTAVNSREKSFTYPYIVRTNKYTHTRYTLHVYVQIILTIPQVFPPSLEEAHRHPSILLHISLPPPPHITVNAHNKKTPRQLHHRMEFQKPRGARPTRGAAVYRDGAYKVSTKDTGCMMYTPDTSPFPPPPSNRDDNLAAGCPRVKVMHETPEVVPYNTFTNQNLRPERHECRI